MRPLIRYFGGKWTLAPWIIEHLPPHRIYVEPFGGGGSVLLRKQRSYLEVYNDVDKEIVNLFRVARDHGEELQQRLKLTPFAREEYRHSFVETEDALEQARRTVVRSFMGFGSNSLCRAVKSGFRQKSHKSGTSPSHDWRNYADALPSLIDRLRGVVIENRDAIEVMRAQDGPDTVHYVDPPYVHTTRSSKVYGHHGYNHEMTDDDHVCLASALSQLDGAVVVSGYHSELYDDLYRNYERIERKAHADGARDRVEVLWLSPNTSTRQSRMSL